MIPEKVIWQINERAKGSCEWCGKSGGTFGLQHAHIVHEGMGGAHGVREKILNDARNIALLCGSPCHDILDGRIYKPQVKEGMKVYLKRKIGWEEWSKESRERNSEYRV